MLGSVDDNQLVCVNGWVAWVWLGGMGMVGWYGYG